VGGNARNPRFLGVSPNASFVAPDLTLSVGALAAVIALLPTFDCVIGGGFMKLEMWSEQVGARLVLLLAATLALGACGSPTEPAARGEYLYNYCAQCHGADGEGSRLVDAPPIAAMPQWYLESQLMKFRDGARGAHPQDIEGLKMRPMARTLKDDADLKTVATYVAGLPAAPPQAATLTGGDAAKGATLFGTCMACHGVDGSGNKALNAPSLIGHPDWYMFAQLKKFKSGVRGTDAKDLTGPAMRAIAMTLPDEQAMKDVVAHILTLR
jgi:cytochrome c553